jgi:hypothetical protein
MIKINILNYVYQYISPLRRKTVIIQILNAFVLPIVYVYNLFDVWRVRKVYEVNLTSQTLALQNHLNNEFDNTLRRVLIQHYNDGGLSIPLSTEGYSGIEFSLISENECQYLSKYGEISSHLLTSFIIYSPSTINSAIIIAEVEKYKLAGKNYTITQF